ncbi:MAG: site-specific integrase, partial [Pseudomonadota bacterium]
MSAWIERFLIHLTHERRLSERTVESYRRDLRGFAAFLAKHDPTFVDDHTRGPRIHWRRVRGGDVRDFAAAKFRSGVSGRTVQRHLAAVRTFFRYLAREGEVTDSPAEGVSAPRVARRLPQSVSVDQTARRMVAPEDSP